MAATSLGRLTLDLVARIGNFTGPMSQAERQAKSSSNNIANSFSVASIAVTALGTAVAGVSLGSMVAFANQTIQTGNEIKKFAQLSNSSAQQFQYYAKGAETAGISMESFADKMKDMQDRIGDFQQTGGGPLADFFTNIAPLVGVTIQQFQKLSGPEALQLYYDSLQKVGASQNDMKFYMEAIISDSSLLIPLLQNGGEGFKKWGDAAQRANAIMSDEMIGNLALAKENLQLMNLQWQGLQATLVNNIVPVVQTVANNMDNIKAVALALTAAVTVKLIPSLIASSFQLAQLAVFSIRAGAGLASFSASAGATSGAMIALRGAMAFLGGPAGLAMLAVQGIAAGAAFLYMKKASDEVKPSLDSQNLSIQELIANYEKLTDSAKRSQLRIENTKLSELSDGYDDAKSKLISLVVAMGRFDGSSAQAVVEANKLAMQYKQGDISAEQLAARINALAGASDASKAKIDSQAGAVSKAKEAMQSQQKIVETLSEKNRNLASTTDGVTLSVNNQAQAWLNLTQKQREALKGIQDQVSKAKYVEANMAAGWSRDKAEYFAEYRQNAGLGFTGATLSPQEIKQVEAGYKLQQQTKAREESEKKIEEAKRKQLELAQKQYQYSGSELEMLKKVASISSQYKLNEIGAKYGVPENLLAGIVAQESKGNPNARSPTGAIGLFQTTSIFRKQWGLSVEDSLKDIPKTAEAIAKALQQGYKEFGNWEDAVTSINAGIGGTKNLNKKGFTGSAAKTKEAKEYAALVDKWFVGLNGSNSKTAGFAAEDAAASLADYQEYLSSVEQAKKDSDDRRKAITERYFSEEERLAYENEEAIKEINLAYAGDDEAIAKYLAKQVDAYAKDLQEFRKVQKQKQFDAINAYIQMQQQIQSISIGADDVFAKATMAPDEYGRWSLLNNRDNAQRDLKNQYVDVQQGIVTSDTFANDDERYQALLDAHQEYLTAKNALDVQYNQQVKDLEMSQYENTLQMYGSLLSQASGVWGGMTQMVKDSAGEQSGAYKAMFLMQQGFAMASALVSAHLAATQVAADATIPFFGGKIAASKAILAMGYANVGMIAAQTISGMAHNGIDNIPKEGTWLLDGGERVLNPQQNKDLTSYLQNQDSHGSGDVNITVQVTDSGVSSSGASTEDQKQLALMIGNMVRSIIRQEKRQGGLLA